MRRVLLALAALVVLGAPAAQAAPVDPKDPVGSAVWVAKCVGDSLGARAAHVPTITPTVATCAGSTNDCITVTVTYPYSAHPILPALPPIFPFLPGTLSSTSVVELSS